MMYIEVEKQDVVQVRDKTIKTLRSRSHMTSALSSGCYLRVAFLRLDHALEVIDDDEC